MSAVLVIPLVRATRDNLVCALGSDDLVHVVDDEPQAIAEHRTLRPPFTVDLTHMHHVPEILTVISEAARYVWPAETTVQPGCTGTWAAWLPGTGARQHTAGDLAVVHAMITREHGLPRPGDAPPNAWHPHPGIFAEARLAGIRTLMGAAHADLAVRRLTPDADA